MKDWQDLRNLSCRVCFEDSLVLLPAMGIPPDPMLSLRQILASSAVRSFGSPLPSLELAGRTT
jgi:hypothetical protein